MPGTTAGDVAAAISPQPLPECRRQALQEPFGPRNTPVVCDWRRRRSETLHQWKDLEIGAKRKLRTQEQLIFIHQIAFEAGSPKFEGFWRRSADETSKLPWPEADESWVERRGFLDALYEKEMVAEKIAYRGYSICRICGCQNGFQTLRLAEWEWPAGFNHYVKDHLVRPCAEFIAFILRPVG